MPEKNVLVTGAAGYIGGQLVQRLQNAASNRRIVATDVRPAPAGLRPEQVRWEQLDVRDPKFLEVLRAESVDTVVHLASIVTPAPGMTREFIFSVDVEGTRNVLQACLAAGVRKLIVTSSGAAYGYHADNPEQFVETDALRGNEAFAYSHHKRLVEEMLAEYRQQHPELIQYVFRLCTVFGPGVRNQISALFERPFVLDVRGSRAPFVFIWDRDVVEVLLRAIDDDRGGIYNVAGDGTLSVREIATRIGKPYVALPAGLLRAALWLLHSLGLSQYGPEQVEFLAYRPVLANRKLKEEFGYTPQRTSAEVFESYRAERANSGSPS